MTAAVMRAPWKLFCACGLMMIAGASRAAAQSACLRDTATARDASVVIFAAVTAGEVTFAKSPTLHVRLCGGLDSVHVLDRRNLPSPVVSGTTYRNVYVAVEIFGRLNADCIARQLESSGAPLDCAALDLRGATSGTRSPTTKPPIDTSRTPRR